jgi:hypothetical protein
MTTTSRAYYAMGFTSVCSNQASNDASYCEIKQKLRQSIQNNLRPLLSIPPVMIFSPQTMQVEILFISKLENTEENWESALSSAIPTNILQIQMGMTIDTPGVASCIDRLICKQIKEQQVGNAENAQIDESFLDAYRIGTHGLMHYLDNRRWKMTKANILRLQQLQNKTNNSIYEKKTERERISREVKVRQFLYEHSKRLIMQDQEKYQYTMIIIESHEMEIRKLEDQEIDIIYDMENLYAQKNQNEMVLKRQLDFQNTDQNETVASKKRLTTEA